MKTLGKIGIAINICVFLLANCVVIATDMPAPYRILPRFGFFTQAAEAIFDVGWGVLWGTLLLTWVALQIVKRQRRRTERLAQRRRQYGIVNAEESEKIA